MLKFEDIKGFNLRVATTVDHRQWTSRNALPPGPVVLVGTDIPAMRAHHVARAFALLGRHDLVFGPARDGGFWLIGARRLRPLPRSLFTNVLWSTPTVLTDTLASLPNHVTWTLADTLDDVDDAEALRRHST